MKTKKLRKICQSKTELLENAKHLYDNVNHPDVIKCFGIEKGGLLLNMLRELHFLINCNEIHSNE
jgi:hypothetical protein